MLGILFRKKRYIKQLRWVIAYVFLIVIACFLEQSIVKTNFVLLSFDVEIGDSSEDIFGIVDLLEDNDISATFFVMGEFAERFPELVVDMASVGEVACHSYSHPKMSRLSFDNQRLELIKCVESIQNVLGKDYVVHGFRAPYHFIDGNTHELLDSLGFAYDASNIENYNFLFTDEKTMEISVSSYFMIPLSDAFLIYLPFPKVFFWLLETESEKYNSYLFHPHRAAKYLPELDFLINNFKQNDVNFVTHYEFFKILN